MATATYPNYTYQQGVKALWEHAVAQYQAGNRDSRTYFEGELLDVLDDMGATAQEVYDFAEDWVNSQVPDFTTFALLADIRRYYFYEKQHGVRSDDMLDPDTLPAKDEEVMGIVWLPRIIAKAKAKLRGELHPDIMYGCGGDRKFLQTHDFHPAQFLRVVMEHEDDEHAIVEWVLQHSRTMS